MWIGKYFGQALLSSSVRRFSKIKSGTRHYCFRNCHSSVAVCCASLFSTFRCTQPFLLFMSYLCRISTGALVRSNGWTCSCHLTGTHVGM